MTKKLIIAALLLSVTLAVFAGRDIFAWFVYGAQRTSANVTTATIGLRSIDANHVFGLDDNQKGIPGEVISLSSENYIQVNAVEPFAFMVTYTCTNGGSVFEGISLRQGSGSVRLEKVPGDNPLSVSYVGVVNSQSRAAINLGELQAEFKASNEINNESYTIESKFICVQKNKDAIYEHFNINPVGQFSFLAE